MTQVAPIATPPAPPAFNLDTNGADAPPPPKMIAVELKRNYRPMSDLYEIVGYNQTEIKVKSAAGIPVVVRPAAFISEPDQVTGKMKGMPPAAAGSGPEAGLNKILAGTVVRLPKDEAKRVVELEIGTRSLED